MSKSYRPADLHAAGSQNPLELAAQGFFWTGGELIETSAGPMMRGQQYVEYWVPQNLLHSTPIVMVHGGGGQATDYLGTADGREGWVHYFVRQGWAVYVVDRPQHGRSPFHPEVQGEIAGLLPTSFLEEMFCRPSDFPERYPQAHLHNKWPGSGKMDDPNFLHFLSGTGPSLASMEQGQLDAQRAGAELLDRIGPAVVMTHSAGGPTGWLVADKRPDLVKAIVAVEPAGPPFAENQGGSMRFGLAAAPLTFDPPLPAGEELAVQIRPAPSPDLLDCKVQQEPARSLPALSNIPIAVFTAEASWMAADNHGTVDFLRQAGASVDHIRLEDQGIHGNGHAMMLETNSDEIAAAILGWITQNL